MALARYAQVKLKGFDIDIEKESIIFVKKSNVNDVLALSKKNVAINSREKSEEISEDEANESRMLLMQEYASKYIATGKGTIFEDGVARPLQAGDIEQFDLGGLAEIIGAINGETSKKD